MPRNFVDTANLQVTGSTKQAQPSLDIDDVLVVVNQAFGPTGESLLGVSDVEFSGYPAITVLARALGREGLVHLSPLHGDRRKLGMEDLPLGTKCELACPRSGLPLDRIGRVVEEAEAEYFAIYLTPRLDRGSMIYVSDVWGHHHSRIVHDNELISFWANSQTPAGSEPPLA